MIRNRFMGELLTRYCPTELFRSDAVFMFKINDNGDKYDPWCYERAFDGLFEFYQDYDFYETV